MSVTVKTPVVLFKVPVTSTCLSLYLFRSIFVGISRTISVPFRSASKYFVCVPIAILNVPARLIVAFGFGDVFGLGVGDTCVVGVGETNDDCAF